MRPAPAKKLHSVIDELNIMSDAYEPTKYEFRLAQIKKEAEHFKQKDPETSYIILGIIACMKNDVERMHRYHKNAIKCSGGSLHAISNYCASLYNQGLFKECYVYSLKAHEIDKTDTKRLQELLRLSYFLRLDESYALYKDKLNELEVEFEDPRDFLEDNDDWLENALTITDMVIEDNPELIVKPNPERETLIDELIEGVIID